MRCRARWSAAVVLKASFQVLPVFVRYADVNVTLRILSGPHDPPALAVPDGERDRLRRGGELVVGPAPGGGCPTPPRGRLRRRKLRYRRLMPPRSRASGCAVWHTRATSARRALTEASPRRGAQDTPARNRQSRGVNHLVIVTRQPSPGSRATLPATSLARSRHRALVRDRLDRPVAAEEHEPRVRTAAVTPQLGEGDNDPRGGLDRWRRRWHTLPAPPLRHWRVEHRARNAAPAVRAENAFPACGPASCA